MEASPSDSGTGRWARPPRPVCSPAAWTGGRAAQSGPVPLTSSIRVPRALVSWCSFWRGFQVLVAIPRGLFLREVGAEVLKWGWHQMIKEAPRRKGDRRGHTWLLAGLCEQRASGADPGDRLSGEGEMEL